MVQSLGAAALLAQLFVLQACGSSNTPTTPGTGGNNSSGNAGTTGTAGTQGQAGNGTAGTTGSAGTTGAFGQPACPDTVSKGGVCAAADIQECFKTCGPEKTGVKKETCTGGVYAEMSGCSFNPASDYSCYKIPTAANTACPAGVMPQASQPCTTDHCVICNSTGGLPGGGYSDSGGAMKVGYCTCQVANSAGTRTWTCASDTAWPCPAGAGC